MVEVVVGVQGGFHGDLTHHPQGIHLERGAARRREALYEKRGVLADEEPAATNGRGPLRKIGDGGVQAVGDSAHGGEALVDKRSLGDAGVIGQLCGEGRQRNTHGQRDRTLRSMKHAPEIRDAKIRW